MNLMVTTKAQKYILMNGGNACAKLERPNIQLGCPDEAEAKDYKEVQLNNQIIVYIHLSLLNLEDKYKLVIDLEWRLLGKKLVLKGL